MSFTPSNLTIANLGSLKLTIAKVDGSITSGTNNWNSGIPDIQAITAQYSMAVTDHTITNLSVSFTQSNGTIWTIIPVSQSATSFNILVYSGFASDMTW